MGGLVVTLKPNEQIQIGETIVTVMWCTPSKVRLYFQGDPNVLIQRIKKDKKGDENEVID